MNDHYMVINYKLEKNKKNYIQNLRNKEIGVKKKATKIVKQNKTNTKKGLTFSGVIGLLSWAKYCK